MLTSNHAQKTPMHYVIDKRGEVGVELIATYLKVLHLFLLTMCETCKAQFRHVHIMLCNRGVRI